MDLPPDIDRRADVRIPVDMWIEEATANAVYFQRSANLSTGGLYLEHSVPQTVGTRMQISFTLPGDNVPVRTAAEIVKVEVHALGMHLRFVDLPAEATARIARYVAAAVGDY